MSETVFVSPTGRDDWSGRLAAVNAAGTDGPVATLRRARDMLRAVPPELDRCLVVQPGTYVFAEALALGPADNGLVIEAADPGTVRLLGGARVTGWQPCGDGLFAADLAGVSAGAVDFRHLVVDGELRPRARLPAEGTFEHASEFKVRWMSTTGGGWQRQPTESELTTMSYRGDDLGAWLDVNNAEVTVFHMWDESMVPVKALDTATRTVTFASPAGHPPGAFGVRKYVVWNTREGMTSPGQWYLDRTRGRVVYWPLPGEVLAEVEVIAPTLEAVIRIQGTAKQPVHGVVLRGLRVMGTTTPCRAGGFGARRYEGAVRLLHAHACTLEDVEIVAVGGQGVKGDAVIDSAIRNCRIHDVGACGITLRGAQTEIAGNHIHHIGRTFPSAIALNAAGRDPGRLRVLRNEIHDAPYTGIAAGGDGHTIAENLIYRVMQVLHDGAAIYITFCKGVTVRGNLVRDVVPVGQGYGVSAYYLDEQAEDCVVERNVSIGVPRPTHNHMARNNVIRNNVFIVDGDASLSFPKSTGYALVDNTLYVSGGLEVRDPGAVTRSEGNLLFHGVRGADGAIERFEITGELPLQAGSSELPVPAPLVLYPAAGSIAVDGRVDAPGYAGPAVSMRQTPGRQAISGRSCSVRLAHDASTLFAVVTVPVKDVDGLVLGDTWTEADGAEICLRNPQNPDGCIYVLHGFADGTCASVTDADASPVQAETFGQQVRYAARIGDGEWTAEWAIPLAALDAEVKPRGRIDINLGVWRSETKEWINWIGTRGETWRLDRAGFAAFPMR